MNSVTVRSLNSPAEASSGAAPPDSPLSAFTPRRTPQTGATRLISLHISSHTYNVISLFTGTFKIPYSLYQLEQNPIQLRPRKHLLCHQRQRWSENKGWVISSFPYEWKWNLCNASVLEVLDLYLCQLLSKIWLWLPLTCLLKLKMIISAMLLPAVCMW